MRAFGYCLTLTLTLTLNLTLTNPNPNPNPDPNREGRERESGKMEKYRQGGKNSFNRAGWINVFPPRSGHKGKNYLYKYQREFDQNSKKCHVKSSPRDLLDHHPVL